MEFATTDLCDEHDDLSIADPLFTNFGSSEPFAGPIATVKIHEDNVLVRQMLESEGAGRVLASR
jgi:regulator of ribonuclease activity A